MHRKLLSSRSAWLLLAWGLVIISCSSNNNHGLGQNPGSQNLEEWPLSFPDGLTSARSNPESLRSLLDLNRERRALIERQEILDSEISDMNQQINQSRDNILVIRQQVDAILNQQASCELVIEEFNSIRGRVNRGPIDWNRAALSSSPSTALYYLRGEIDRTMSDLSNARETLERQTSQYIDTFSREVLQNNPELNTEFERLLQRNQAIDVETLEIYRNRSVEVSGTLNEFPLIVTQGCIGYYSMVAQQTQINGVLARALEVLQGNQKFEDAFPLEQGSNSEIYEAILAFRNNPTAVRGLQNWREATFGRAPSDRRIIEAILQSRQELLMPAMNEHRRICDQHQDNLDRLEAERRNNSERLQEIRDALRSEALQSSPGIELRRQSERLVSERELLASTLGPQLTRCQSIVGQQEQEVPNDGEALATLRHLLLLRAQTITQKRAIAETIQEIENKAAQVHAIKAEILRSSPSDQVILEALRALLLIHSLASEATLTESATALDQFQQILSENSTEGIFNLKTRIDDAVARHFWNGQAPLYNSQAENFFDLFMENKMQCYSGTLHFIKAFTETVETHQLPLQRLVLIFTPGHVLPGVITNQDGDWQLTGIETTVGGRGLVEFGSTSKIGGEIRIVSLMDFVLIELFKNDIQDLDPTLLSTKRFLNYYGFNPDQFIDPQQSVRRSSTLALLNGSPLGFGQSVVPDGDTPRDEVDVLPPPRSYLVQGEAGLVTIPGQANNPIVGGERPNESLLAEFVEQVLDHPSFNSDLSSALLQNYAAFLSEAESSAVPYFDDQLHSCEIVSRSGVEQVHIRCYGANPHGFFILPSLYRDWRPEHCSPRLNEQIQAMVSSINQDGGLTSLTGLNLPPPPGLEIELIFDEVVCLPGPR